MYEAITEKNLERNNYPTEKGNQTVLLRFQDRLRLVLLKVSSLMILCVKCFDPLIISVLSISDESLLFGLINIHLIRSLHHFYSVYFRATSGRNPGFTPQRNSGGAVTF